MSNEPVVSVRSGERGIALVIAVLFLLLASVLAATFMITASGERNLSSNVHVAKGALYAADAGVRVTQQKIANMAKTKFDSLVTNYSGVGMIIKSPKTFFPAGAIVSAATSPNFSASATIAFIDSSSTDTAQVYNYLCTVTSTGSQGTLGSRKVLSQNQLKVSASRGSFSDYLMFIDTFTSPTGGAIWLTSSGNFDGRMHTNGEFRFAYNPTFQDLVTSVNSKAWYNNNGNPKELAANFNGKIDVPKFYGGFNRGVADIDMPANVYSQQNAALGYGSTGTAPTNTQINTALGLSGSGTPATGVYAVNDGSNKKLSGGIYVQGDLDQFLLSVDGSNRQVYTMKQGSNTTTITIDVAADKTYLKLNSGATTTYKGIPLGITYVQGKVNDLRGPDRSGSTIPPAIDASTSVTITAKDDLILQRDITSQDYGANSSVLGILSANGNIRIGTNAPKDMQLDAMVMSISSNGQFTVDSYNSGSSRGTFHLRGCSIAKFYGAFGTMGSSGSISTGYGRDFRYDDRGLIPPYFPTTNVVTANSPSARTIVWKEL